MFYREADNDILSTEYAIRTELKPTHSTPYYLQCSVSSVARFTIVPRADHSFLVKTPADGFNRRSWESLANTNRWSVWHQKYEQMIHMYSACHAHTGYWIPC